jgi:hypothetical protein
MNVLAIKAAMTALVPCSALTGESCQNPLIQFEDYF